MRYVMSEVGSLGRVVACVGVFLVTGMHPTAAVGQETLQPAEPSLDAVAWLAGCWKAESPDGSGAVEEQWMAPRGGLMVGMSRSVRNGEARGYELLTLRVAGGSLVYHAAPSGQSPTNFTARRVEAKVLEFVNPLHDFPRKIVYSRQSDGSLVAGVYRGVDDEEPSFAIPYRRAACPSG